MTPEEEEKLEREFDLLWSHPDREKEDLFDIKKQIKTKAATNMMKITETEAKNLEKNLRMKKLIHLLKSVLLKL